jgi:TPP-dependent 2-oxoacid decarboxylase
MNKGHTISSYLIDKLCAHGVRHIFGVPGDYVLAFYEELEKSQMKVINTGDEQGAGFAADAYARTSGLGAVCITYCVGGLKVANTTAQAFAEKSPVVVISGAPGTNERIKKPLLHHRVRDFDSQLKVFEQLTVASTVLNNSEIACSEIDRVFSACLRYKRPVYIELPRDMINLPTRPSHQPRETVPSSDANALREALVEAIGIINAAKKPVIIAGVELHRFGLQNLLLRLLENSKIPVASTILSKSVIVENHPQYLGVYEGAMAREEVREYVESSDCLILLGAFMSDINLGIFTAHLDQGKSIYVTTEKVSIQYHAYEGVEMEDFIRALTEAKFRQRKRTRIPRPPSPEPVKPVPEREITVRYLFQRLNSFLDDNTVVIADPGDAMFGAMDMTIHCATEFLSPAYYTSLGFAVPASLGTQLARPELRPLVLVGDGAFQMTGMELATIARFHLTPIVVVLNNQGYGTERPMIDGRFNDIPLWNYSRVPEVLGSGKGYDIRTEDQLEQALQEAQSYTDSFCILDVHLDRQDRSLSLERLTNALSKRVK